MEDKQRFCPICRGFHDPDFACTDRAGAVLRAAGIERRARNCDRERKRRHAGGRRVGHDHADRPRLRRGRAQFDVRAARAPGKSQERRRHQRQDASCEAHGIPIQLNTFSWMRLANASKG